MTIKTTADAFGIAYADADTALGDYPTVTQQVAQTVADALKRGGVAPPGAQDLVGEAGTRKTADDALSARVAALEATTPSCRRYRATTLSAPNGAVTAVPLDTTSHTRGSGVAANGGGIMVLAAGLYAVKAGMNFAGGTSGQRILIIRKNGTSVLEAGPTSTTVRCTASDDIVLATNDVIDLACYVDGGAAVSVSASLFKDVFLTVTRLDKP